MSQAAQSQDPHEHDHPSYLQHHFDTPVQQFDAGKLGMWLFLATEVLLFGGLFVAYTIYRSNHPEIFIYAHQFLDKKLGGINTVVLLCSSLTMAWGVRAAQLGQNKLLRVLLVLTLLGGFGFMGIKFVEYRHKWHAGLLWGTNFQPNEHAVLGHATGENAPPEAPARPEHSTGAEAGTSTTHGAEAGAKSGQTAEAGNTAQVSGSAPGAKSGQSAEAGNTAQAGGGAPTTAPGASAQASATSPAAATKIEASTIAPAAEGPAGTLTAAQMEANKRDRGLEHQPSNTQIFFGIYFLMTGLHGLHVLIGMIAITWVLVKSIKGQFSPAYFSPVDFVGLYWHLVDLIWIFLFPLLYLIH